MTMHNPSAAFGPTPPGLTLARSVLAAENGESIRFYVSGVTASPQSRTLTGEVVAFGGPVDAEHPEGTNVGLTNVGPLRVAKRGQVVAGNPASGLRWSDDLSRLKLTAEHDRSAVRGYGVSLVESAENLRGSFKANSDPDGDAAIAEALDHKRDGFSIDVVNGVVVDADDGGAPWLVSGDLIAVGQVGLPAYWQGSRIDTVAAAAATTERQDGPVTEQERIRLAELRAKQNRTAEEEAELSGLAAKEEAAAAETPSPADPAPEAPAAPQAVAASLPTVPGGIPRPGRAPVTTGETPLDAFCQVVSDAFAAASGLAPGNGQSIMAALTDITHAANGGNISQPAWSGELWSGVQHEQEFVPLLNSGNLTGRKGQGWRFTDKPEIADYAGGKAAIPSDTIATELAEYTASRMAVGHDIDRAYYDFPDVGFIRAYVEAVRESWSIKIDGKVEAWIAANAVDSGVDLEWLFGDGTSMAKTVLKAVALGGRKVKRAKMGKATFAIVHDDLFDSLMELAELDLPAFLELFGVQPSNFVASSLAAYEGRVVVGTKMAATVRTLPGSPIRVSAQHIANGGIDEAFFGYYAIEQHAANGIQDVDLAEGAEPA